MPMAGVFFLRKTHVILNYRHIKAHKNPHIFLGMIILQCIKKHSLPSLHFFNLNNYLNKESES